MQCVYGLLCSRPEGCGYDAMRKCAKYRNTHITQASYVLNDNNFECEIMPDLCRSDGRRVAQLQKQRIVVASIDRLLYQIAAARRVSIVRAHGFILSRAHHAVPASAINYWLHFQYAYDERTREYNTMRCTVQCVALRRPQRSIDFRAHVRKSMLRVLALVKPISIQQLRYRGERAVVVTGAPVLIWYWCRCCCAAVVSMLQTSQPAELNPSIKRDIYLAARRGRVFVRLTLCVVCGCVTEQLHPITRSHRDTRLLYQHTHAIPACYMYFTRVHIPAGWHASNSPNTHKVV